ncbi:hypothetical protein K456DRAFT_51097 [Colletotrichum gloeosporioides 23]|nr:hypothetical protein K456DRAFT_51097 [Colletotrichum gloeosporioides 23]
MPSTVYKPNLLIRCCLGMDIPADGMPTASDSMTVNTRLYAFLTFFSAFAQAMGNAWVSDVVWTPRRQRRGTELGNEGMSEPDGNSTRNRCGESQD